MAPATLAGAPAPSNNKQSAPVALVPFVRAAHEHTEQMMDVTTGITAAGSQLSPVDVPAYGFLRGIWLEVTISGGAGSAVFRADAPFNALQDIQLSDVNGAPIVGPLDGYDLYQINKLGGYRRIGDPKGLPGFTQNVAGGNASYLLYLPVEVNGRDALGSLANMNAASSYKLRMGVAPAGSIYSTLPATTLPSIRVRAWLDAYTQPADVALDGRPNATLPPAHGTTSFWSKQTFNINSGANQLRLARVGNYVREHILIFRDAAGNRVETLIPASLDVTWDTRLLRNLAPSITRATMAYKHSLPGALDGANGQDAGVIAEDYCHEFDGKAGGELRDGWLPTTQSSRLEFSGTFPGACTVTVLTNDVSPAGEVFV